MNYVQPLRAKPTNPAILLLIHQKILSDSVAASAKTWRFKDVTIARFKEEAFRLVSQHAPDVVVVDALSGFGELRQLLRSFHFTCPNARIVVFNGTLQRNELIVCLACRVSGYLSADAPMHSLEAAIESVSSGKLYLPAAVAQLLQREYSQRGKGALQIKVMQISAREQEIASTLANGMSNKQIAAKLGISVRTVEKHRENIARKFAEGTELTCNTYIKNKSQCVLLMYIQNYSALRFVHF
jgi:DNA-binding NarL/FixJ family response regulator